MKWSLLLDSEKKCCYSEMGAACNVLSRPYFIHSIASTCNAYILWSLYLFLFIETFSVLCSIFVLEPLMWCIKCSAHVIQCSLHSIHYCLLFSAINQKFNDKMMLSSRFICNGTGIDVQWKCIDDAIWFGVYSFCHDAKSTTASTNDVAFS